MFTRERLLDHLILLGCLVLASYFTTIQFIRSDKNEDLSLLSYRKLKFDSESKDQYPIYTICLHGRFGDGSIYNPDSQVWKSDFITYETYRRFLIGRFNYKWRKALTPTPNTTYRDIMQTFSEIKFFRR